MITAPQLKLLNYILQQMKLSGGVAPTYKEMATEMQFASKGSVHRVLMQLEDRGFIKRMPYRSRAIEVLKLPNLNPPKESDDERRRQE